MKVLCARAILTAAIAAVSLFLSGVPAFAVVSDLTVTGLPPDTAISLTQDGNPQVKLETKSDSKGVARFSLGSFNLPAGSDVRVTAAGDSRIVPSLADGSNTRDFRFPDRAADTGKGPDQNWVVEVEVGPGFRIAGGRFGEAFSGVFLANDERILATEQTIIGFNPKLNLNGNLLGQKLQMNLNGFYGSARNSDSVPIGGPSVGITGDHGFAGIALGPTGADMKGRVDAFGGEFNAVFPNLFYYRQWRRSDFGIGPRLTIGYDQTNYRTTFNSPTFSGISSVRNREVEQVYFGPGVTLQKNHELTGNIHLYAGINVDALYNVSDLDTQQRIRCDLCPLDLTIGTADKNSGWIFRPGVSVGLEYELNSWSIGLNASYQYWHKMPLLRDRASPADRPPGLVGEGVHRAGFGVSLKYEFGGPEKSGR